MVESMKTTRRRKLAGDIVEAEYARQRMTRQATADRMKMSPSTLDRVRQGDATLTTPKLRSVEGVLNLPDDLLTFIAEGNVAAIEAIGADEMRPGMRRRIMDGLAQIASDEVEGPARMDRRQASQ